MEQIKSGTTGSLVGDLNYTLRQWPNHHRALWSVTRFQLDKPKKLLNELNDDSAALKAYAPCYFERAIKFAADDAVVYMIYGVFLHRSGKLDDALKKYKMAEKLQPKWSELNYNMGLLYFDQKNYKLAQEYGQKAYQLGYPLPGLRNKLKSVGIQVSK